MTEYAQNGATEHAKKLLEESRRVREQTAAAPAAAGKGKPTPTQEENDLVMLGAQIVRHDDDGSGPDPNVVTTRHMEAQPAGAPYQTRQASASRSAPPPRTPQE